MARTSSSSRRGRLGESAMTARALSPRTLRAAHARNTESTPPEYATRHEPYELSKARSFSYFCNTTQYRVALIKTNVERREGGQRCDWEHLSFCVPPLPDPLL